MTAIREKERGASHAQRVLTVLIIVPLLVLFIYYLPPYPYFFALLLAVALVSTYEFYDMYSVPLFLSVPALAFGGALLYVICFLPRVIPETLFAGMSLVFLLRILAGGSPSTSMRETGPVSTGLLYIIGFISFLWYLREGAYGREYILLLLTSGWFADSSAYYAGTYMGRRKLCPSISPKKTYEGAMGSILGGAAGSVIIASMIQFPDVSFLKASLIGAVIGFVTILGDLIESMFKRGAGVKDSGRLIPGHGGFLDKIDGFLLSAPVLYFILRVL